MKVEYTSLDNLDSGWLGAYAAHDATSSFWGENPPTAVADIVNALRPGHRVLEICAGDGRITRELIKSQAEIIPSDISVHALEHMAGAFRGCGLAVPLGVVAPADKLPFGHETFDAVVSWDGICQIGTLRDALKEVHRVLKPNGSLICDVFTPEDAAWGQGEQINATSWAYKGTLFNFFTTDQFTNIVKDFFKVERVFETRWEDPPHGDFRPTRHTHVADVFFLRKI